jgi:hypothetical protein
MISLRDMRAIHRHAGQRAGRVAGQQHLRPQKRDYRQEREGGAQALAAESLHRWGAEYGLW